MKTKLMSAVVFGLSLFAAASCDNTEIPTPEPKPERKMIIIKSFSGADLQEGLQLGLFVKNPSYDNVCLTVGANGTVTSQDSIYWNLGQTEKSAVMAYMPYCDSLTSADMTFTVNADQSTGQALKGSDLLIATCEADPTQESLSLSLEHQMSQACIYFNNKTGDSISKVVFGGICLSQKFNAWTGAGQVFGEGTVTAYSDNDHFTANFPAQTAGMTIKVTMVGGAEYSFELESNNFIAGKSYSNSKSPIEIAGTTAKQINVNFSVSDWVDGGQLTLKGNKPTPVPGGSATLTYAEAKGTYTYNSPVSYTNDFGEWEICCYSDNNTQTGFQLNSSTSSKTRLAYIGTPEFSDQIIQVTISAIEAYSDNLYICETGSEDSSAILKTEKGDGTEITIDVSDLGVSKLYIMSAKRLNIKSITIETGSPAPVEETPFTKTSTAGFYSNTSTTPESSLIIAEQDQYSCGKSSAGRVLSVVDFSKGIYKILTVGSSSLNIGSQYKAELNENGSITSYSGLSCVKKTSSQVWLEDKTQNIGFIIPIE